MAIRKCRLVKTLSDGTQDTMHLETGSEVVVRPSGETVENALADLKTTIGSVGLPAGGTTGQVPAKNSNANYDVGWITPLKSTDTAAAATKLATARTIAVNLASSTAASFNGTANVTAGVSGVLPVANGGTGNTTGLAASATKLATARTIQTNLGSGAAAAFDGSANIAPGITGILPVANGGTGTNNIDSLKTTLGITVNSIAPPAKPAVNSATGLGTVINWAGIPWVVVHLGTTYAVLALERSLENGSITRHNMLHYISDITVSQDMQAAIVFSDINNLFGLDYVVSLNGTPVFFPIYSQVNGGFSHYATPANRRFLDIMGTPTTNWLIGTGVIASENYIYMQYVDSGGGIITPNVGDNLNTTYFYRPHVMIKL